MTDHLTEAGATALGRQILAFWQSQGASNVKVEVYQLRGTKQFGHGACWGITSNLMRGLPPRKAV